jgi:hypothetical protein
VLTVGEVGLDGGQVGVGEERVATTALSTLKRTLVSSINAADAHRSTRPSA